MMRIQTVVFLCFFTAFQLSGQSLTTNDKDLNKNAARNLVLKTSPFDYLVGRFLTSFEYRLEKNNSIELTMFTDHMRLTDPFAGLQDFGRMYHFNLRYKFYFAQKILKENNRQRMNGFYYSPGISTGITPLIDGTIPTSFAYIPDRQNERSTFIAFSSDIGYATSYKAIQFEFFGGLEYARHTRSAIIWTDNQGNQFIEEKPFLSPRIRIGCRIGYYLL